MIIISACLCGCNCKYNGKNNKNEQCVNLFKSGKATLICPEQLGGMTTPRLPSEILKNEENKLVINKNGENVTDFFERGAKEALNIAKLVNSKVAILKDGSPSCGSEFVYDGNFSGNKIKGQGITAELFIKNGIKVFSEKNMPKESLENLVFDSDN